MRTRFARSLLCAVSLATAGCAALGPMQERRPRAPSGPRGPHGSFRAQENWRKLTYRHSGLLARAVAGNSALEISLADQRGLLLVDGDVAMDFPVATGKASHPTPEGHYRIMEKKKDHASNLYGRIVSPDGQTVVADADTRAHPVPEGGRFVGAPMPYWMRLTATGVGLHVGHVPDRPASHGCIRLKRGVAEELFGILEVGSPVTIGFFAPSLGALRVGAQADSGAPGRFRAPG